MKPSSEVEKPEKMRPIVPTPFPDMMLSTYLSTGLGGKSHRLRS